MDSDSDRTLVVWDEVLTSYDFGPTHPLRPLRLELTMDLAWRTGALQGALVEAPVPADDGVLALVHDPTYISAVKLARPDLAFGLGSSDNPVFARMHEASALAAGATVQAAAAVWQGRVRRAVSIAGGLHHAMRRRASGFCIYDDPALAIAWLLAEGAQRVAYVDVDVHHGDGVQAAFHDDPRVMTISLHESGDTLFPGTGWPDETGVDGTSVNVAFPAGTGSAAWLRVFGAIVPPALRAFGPEILLTQHGCDTHHADPLAHLLLSVDAQAVTHRWLRSLADELCGGRWVAVGGGGYAATTVVPRSWTHLLATATGTRPDGPTPPDWQQLVLDRTGGRGEVPLHLLDGEVLDLTPWQPGADDPAWWTRREVWPLLGLDLHSPGDLPPDWGRP
jgi:acetoin utilization protein AcuC